MRSIVPSPGIALGLPVLSFVPSALAFKPERGYRAVPADYGIIRDAVDFAARDSLRRRVPTPYPTRRSVPSSSSATATPGT